jgi:hypothetical protein
MKTGGITTFSRSCRRRRRTGDSEGDSDTRAGIGSLSTKNTEVSKGEAEAVEDEAVAMAVADGVAAEVIAVVVAEAAEEAEVEAH